MISINKINIQYVKHHFLPILTELNLKIFLFALGAFSILATSFYLCYVHYLKAKKVIPQSTNRQITKPLLNQIPTFLGTPIAEDLDHLMQTQNPQLIQVKESQGLIFNKNIPQVIEILIYSFLDPQSVCRFAWVNQSSHNLSKQPQIIALLLNNVFYMSEMILEKLKNKKPFLSELRTKIIKLATNRKIGPLLKTISFSGDSYSYQDLMPVLNSCQNLEKIFFGHILSKLNSVVFDQVKNQLNEMKKLKKLILNCREDDKVLDLIPIGIESLQIATTVNPRSLSTTFKRLTNLKELTILNNDEYHEYFAHLSRLESLNCCSIKVCTNKRLIEIFDGLKNLKKFTGKWRLREDLEPETLQHLPECMEELSLTDETRNISNEDFKLLFERLKNLKRVVFDFTKFQSKILTYLPSSLEQLILYDPKPSDFTFLETQRLVNLKMLLVSSYSDQPLLYLDIPNSFFSQLPKSLLDIDFFNTNIAEKDYVKNYIQIRRQCPNAKIKLPREENQPDLAELEARGESIFEISDKQVV